MSDIEYKRCLTCGQEYPATTEYFWKDKSRKSGLREHCKNCVNKHPVDRIPKGTKRCTKCKMILPATEIYFRYIRSKQGYFGKCRECEHKHDAEVRKNNPSRFNDAQKRFRLNHPEQAKLIKKKWNDKNKIKIAIKNAKRYIVKRDVLLEQNRQHRLLHPEQIRAKSQKRRSLIKNAQGSHTADDIKRLYEEQNGLCFYCGQNIYWSIPYDVHVEHVQPLSKNGSNGLENLALTCAECNLEKGNKTVDEWRLIRGW